MAAMYGLDKEGQGAAERAARIAREVAGPNAADVDSRARFPEESIAALAKDGLMGLTLHPPSAETALHRASSPRSWKSWRSTARRPP